MSQEGSPEHHFLPTFHSIGVKVYQVVSLRYHFLPTWHGIVGKLCQVIHLMHYLPRYLWGSASGGQFGVSFFPAIHGRLSRPFEADSPAPPSLRPHRHPCRTATHPPHLRRRHARSSPRKKSRRGESVRPVPDSSVVQPIVPATTPRGSPRRF